MKLSELLQDLTPVYIKAPQASASVEVTGICHDSRVFHAGNLFVAVRGHQFDGHLFVSAACDLGASAVMVEDDHMVPSKFKGAVIKVKNSRKSIDVLASRFYNFPSEHLFVVGVTGTNGKTTTTHMIEAILNPELPTSVMGTIDYHFGGHVSASTHTTPDALQIQKYFSEWVKMGAKAVAVEVSSHALSLNRVDSVQFDAAVFTNLTRDHLDFHKTMALYEQAKSKLFSEVLVKSIKKSKRAIVNGDDPHAFSMMSREVPTWTYGLRSGDIKILNHKLTLDKSEMTVQTPCGVTTVELSMIGLHNLYNAMAAIGVGLHAGMDLKNISEKLSYLKSVRGRLERVDAPHSSIRVFVDYAHTDDALRSSLTFLKDLRAQSGEKNRIITMFGCGGDRDRGKRPLMMKTAESLSDLVIVTSDNPRTENPESIIDEVLAGATPMRIADGIILVEADRRKAIALAIKKADPGDVVLIAGKGHEDYQIIGTKKFPFDDLKIAMEALNS